MIRQRMISVKLDVDQLALLDDLCHELGCNRNKMINFAVKMVNSNLKSPFELALTSAYSRALREII